MNRIEELSKKVIDLVNNEYKNLSPDFWIEVYNKKFAELIIRECCIALNPMLRDMISRGQGVDLIKLHFGMNPKEITTAMLDAAIAQCNRELAKQKSGEK